jgi:hypothetical protein
MNGGTAAAVAFSDDHDAEPRHAVARREGSHGVADLQVKVLRADPFLEVQPTKGVA